MNHGLTLTVSVSINGKQPQIFLDVEPSSLSSLLQNLVTEDADWGGGVYVRVAERTPPSEPEGHSQGRICGDLQRSDRIDCIQSNIKRVVTAFWTKAQGGRDIDVNLNF